MKLKTIIIMLLCASCMYAQNAVSPGDIKIDPTFEHIGILYNINGDANLNSNLQIEFRKQGESNYKQGAITMRSHSGLVIDGQPYNANHHAGSAMFLQANTTYQIRLTLTDPDGGGTTQTVSATTKAYPVESSNYQYVAPGNGGGNGTSSNPYRGLQTAADNATAGTTFIVRPGNYSPFELTKNGAAGAPITFRSETLHAAVVDGANTSRGVVTLGAFQQTIQHVIIDGFQIQNGEWGIDAQNTQYMTVKNCKIENVSYGIFNRRQQGVERDQYITNNYISGRNTWPGSGIPPERGINLRGNRNVVSFNTIENFSDGIATDGQANLNSHAMDVHNNDIRNMVDDLIEVDLTVSNTRVYLNRVYNGRMGVSLAPIYGGPCYVFRNEIYNIESSTYKMNRAPSGLVIVHNTSAKSGNGISSPPGWKNTFVKNNIIMGAEYCFEEYGTQQGLTDDWDYNAYFSPRSTTSAAPWFKWNTVRYGDINALRNGTSIEDNGLAISNSDLANVPIPANYSTEYSPDDTDFRIENTANLRNNGVNLDNLNDGFVSDGQPDRGAYEFGSTPPKFGADFSTTCTDADGDGLCADIDPNDNDPCVPNTCGGSECELLTNTTFDNNTDPWVDWGADYESLNGLVAITNIQPSDVPWGVGFVQRNIPVEQGEDYTVKFSARADASRPLMVLVEFQGSPYTRYFETVVNLSPTMQDYTFDFTMTEATDNNANFIFYLGGNTVSTYIDNVSLQKTDCEGISCPQQGQSCNDQDPCTTRETYDANCNCTGGTYTDADGDGVCVGNDPNDNDPCVPNTCGGGGCELLTNTTFDNNTDSWVHFNADVESVNGLATITDIQPRDRSWGVGFTQKNIPVEQGEDYTIKFRASADANRPLTLMVELKGSPYTRYFETLVNLSPVMQDYTLDFTMNEATDNNANFSFYMGGNQTNTYIDNASLIKNDCNTDSPKEDLSSTSSFTLYPNPANHNIQLVAEISENTQAQIQIYDAFGKLVKQINEVELMTGSPFDIEVSQLPTGMYFCTLQSGEWQAVQKFVIAR